MSLPPVVTRAEWLTARRDLLAAEKDLTRRRDAVSARRRDLPMVRHDGDQVLHGSEGLVGLRDLFGTHRQLVVYHFMFHPDWDRGCPACTAMVDGIGPGVLAQLAQRSTAFALVSRAPFDKLERYRAERGWSVPWYSSHGSSFNLDLGVTIDASARPVTHNFRGAAELVGSQEAWVLDPANQPVEISGVSCFLRVGDDVFHTYTAHQRGLEPLIGAYQLLDLTVLGRQEAWEQPAGRVDRPGPADPSFGGWGANGPGAPVEVGVPSR